jgi:biopolymer transport protein ExbD
MAMSSGDSQGPITGINITPLVDVCLVLVIIFMVTAPLLTQPVLSVELPKAHTAESKDKENITVTVTKDGHWALNEAEMNFEDLGPRLREKVRASRDRYVIIRADRETSYRFVLDALRLARQAGAKDFSIATEQKPKGESA